MKLLTIGIPTYNRKTYLQECIERLLPQVEENREQVELYISDNCSNDDTSDFLKQIALNHPAVTYYIQPENLGAERNFISIFNHAVGKYVWILSDDDIVVDNGVKHILEYLEKNPDLNYVHMNNYFFKGEYSQESMLKPRLTGKHDTVFTSKNDVIETVGCNITLITTSIFNTDVIHKIDDLEQYIPTLFVQGYAFLLSTKDSEVKVGYIGKPVVAVRQNSEVKYNMYLIFGEGLWNMMQYAVQECGYPFKEVYKAYYDYWRKVVLMGVVGAKANGYKNMYKGFGRFFKATWTHPRAWVELYPMLLVPAPFYAWIKKMYHTIKKMRQ